MPSQIEPGASESAFTLSEKKIEKLVRESLGTGERLIRLYFDRRPPAGKSWEKYGTAYAERYFEAELEVPAFDYDAAPEMGEKAVIRMRGYAGLHLNCVVSPEDIRAGGYGQKTGIEVYSTIDWL